MTEEDIRKLAQEYERQSVVKLCVATHSDIVIDFMDWISEKFCIVEKEKVESKYRKAKELYKRWHDEYERSAIDTMESIFSKELFNDTEK